MPFRIIRDDITRVQADAIVNTANPRPVIGSGTDSAVYEAAGAAALLADRQKIGTIPPGEVAVTGAHALQARYILHTVGPAWDGAPDGTASEENKALLASCYRKSLLLAQQLGCESIAFPLISSGNYRYPKEEALRIALDTIRTFLDDSEMDVTLVVYDKNAYALSAELTDHVDAYIDEKYIEAKAGRPAHPNIFSGNARREREWEPFAFREETAGAPMPGAAVHADELEEHALQAPQPPYAYPQAARPDAAGAARKDRKPEAGIRPLPSKKRKLSDLIAKKHETFQEHLLRLIDEKGYTDVEVYKRANLDRKLFSKIRCNPDYHPQKRTAVALAMALQLNMDETTDLLRLAGIAMSPASMADLIVSYCIENGIYDLFEVNALLFDYDQPLLG